MPTEPSPPRPDPAAEAAEHAARRREALRRNPTRRRTARDHVVFMDRVEMAALRTVDGLLRLMSVDRASALMGWAWRLLAPFNPRHRRADGHLAAAMPELSAAERRAILARMWENLGRTAAETLRLDEIIADRSRFELVPGDVIGHPEVLKDGAVFASLHQGNWELAGWGIRLAGCRVAAVYNPLQNPLAEAFLLARRTPAYDAGLFTRDRVAALKLRSLARTGVAIGMLADLNDFTGVTADFFGRPARLAIFPAVLARRLGLPLVAGRVLRTEGARFRVEATRIEVPVTDDVDADIRAAALALHALFEDYIRDAPDQWMWAHRKWRPRPAWADGPTAPDTAAT